MNAPYDGDRGQGSGGSAAGDGRPYADPRGDGGQVPPPQHAPDAYPQDAYLQDAYQQDPYRAHDLSAQDPVTEALYDRAAHPPPPPGTYQAPGPLYAPPPAGQYQPDPRVWAQTPAPEPEGPSQYLPYGDDARTTQFVGVDDLVTQAGEERHEPDAFAHLFRDQQPGYGGGRAPAPQSGYGANGAPAPQSGYGGAGAPAPQSGYGGAGAPAPQSGYGQGHAPAEMPVDDPTQFLGQAPLQAPAPAPVPAAAPKKSGRASSLMKSSAVMAAGTLVSRLTGFVRTMVITAALGAGLLGDTWTVAYTLPTMIYILTVGGGLNSVFVPQLVRSMKEDEDGGEAYANRLLTLVMVALAVIVAVVVFAAPLLIQLMSNTVSGNTAANSVGVTFARYCLPTIFFMGVHVVMGQILNARGKFGAMMWTPVLNNIVMIFTFGMFIWVYGTAAESHMGVTTIPADGVRLLGIGTLLGLTVQALAMIPYLRETGFRFRLRFDWKGHGLGKAVKLAKWTVLFVLANQAGVIVVTQLATAAGEASPVKGTGILGYSNAQLIWGMPQAIITVSVMAAMLPRISRSAHDDDPGAVRDDISAGLRTSAVAIVPVAFMFVALGVPMCTLLFGSSGIEAAQSMGYILMAFGLGLIPFSVQYVVLRGFYAYEDTRTPFYNTVIVAAINAAASGLCYVILPARWAVVGMAFSYGLAYAIGVGVAWRRLRMRLGGDLDGANVVRTYARLCLASVPAAIIGGGIGYALMMVLGHGVVGSIAALVVGGAGLLGSFYVAARKMRIEELNSMVGMVRGRLGR
ncbi:murein biosynthesis integral membrane protein MurJ [Streptomyces sp. NPDC049813]|uniref:murein biosynthesis integral membrane protein MurJ n=1 Tax=Streptomyces sp. NPDC049813 TaxID=3365597 RepID=UPI00379075A7